MASGEQYPRGVGGWLAFLIIALVFIGPFYGYVTTNSDLGQAEFSNPDLVASPAWTQVKIVSWITWATQAVLSIFTGIRLAKDFTPSSVRYAIFILWFNNLGLTILAFIGLSLNPSYDTSAALGPFLGTMMAGTITAGIWTTYLLRSKRVKNTYYANAFVGPDVDHSTIKKEATQLDKQAESAPTIELYDRRYDWLVCFSFVLFPVWPLYSFPVALASVPVFLLVGYLKPLRTRLGSLMSTGAFAAGVCLLTSPLLQLGLDEYRVDDIVEWFRNLIVPLLGLGLMANVWFGWPKSTKQNGTALRLALRWGAFPLAGLLAILGFVPEGRLISAVESRSINDSFAGGNASTSSNVDEALRLIDKLEEERAAQERPLQRQSLESQMKGGNLQTPQSGNVGLEWLVGSWAPMNDGTDDPAVYCAADLGYRFDTASSYSGVADSGRYEIINNGETLMLTERLGHSIGGLESEQIIPLAPTFLKVRRVGDRLEIDGEAYGRCR